MHSANCPTCGCPSPMASPTHSPSSSAPPTPSTSSSPVSSNRTRCVKRKRLTSIRDELNSADELNSGDEQSAISDEKDNNNNSSDVDGICDDVVATHLRHMEAREHYEEFQGQLPMSRCQSSSTVTANVTSSPPCSTLRVTRSVDKAKQSLK